MPRSVDPGTRVAMNRADGWHQMILIGGEEERWRSEFVQPVA